LPSLDLSAPPFFFLNFSKSCRVLTIILTLGKFRVFLKGDRQTKVLKMRPIGYIRLWPIGLSLPPPIQLKR
jgi:hypothetical protein